MDTYIDMLPHTHAYINTYAHRYMYSYIHTHWKMTVCKYLCMQIFNAVFCACCVIDALKDNMFS